MIHDYESLREHIGHEIECVCYGKEKEDPADISLECVTCGAVLLDFEQGDWINKYKPPIIEEADDEDN